MRKTERKNSRTYKINDKKGGWRCWSRRKVERKREERRKKKLDRTSWHKHILHYKREKENGNGKRKEKESESECECPIFWNGENIQIHLYVWNDLRMWIRMKFDRKLYVMIILYVLIGFWSMSWATMWRTQYTRSIALDLECSNVFSRIKRKTKRTEAK